MVEGGTTIGAKEGDGGGAATQTWRRPPLELTNNVLPSGLMATSSGQSNCAASPTPSAVPSVPLPASVVTAPLATSTRRILLFIQSATNSAPPSGLTAMPAGLANCAASPTPSASPSSPLPASVVTP